MTAMQSAMGLLYTTWPDAKSAHAAAEALLSEGLIACANILGEAQSVFVWDGAVQQEAETIALFKTSRAQSERTARRLAELHPYEEPAILNLSVDPSGSSEDFLAWVARQSSPQHRPD